MAIRLVVPACLCIAAGLHVPAHAQYIKAGSIGETPAVQTDTRAGACGLRPLSAMKGERVLFLPRPKSLQHFGYQDFKGGGGEYGHPAYEEAVGRIGVLTVSPKPSISGLEEYTVTITMEDNHQVYTHESLGQPESLDGIAFISDLECAKKELLGKTIWYVGAGVDQNGIEVYDETTDKTTNLNLPKPTRLQVKEVVAGWYNHVPVRLIVVTESGSEAFVDVSLSGINSFPFLRDAYRFEDAFTREDPRKLYSWPDKVWQAIREHKVYVGMTQQQAAFSWGKPVPHDIHSSITASGRSVQWHYESQNLYFENGILTAMQNN